MASLALLNSKPYYAYTMLGYGKDTGPIPFKYNHQTRPRAYRRGYYFHPTRRNGSSKILSSLTDDIFQAVIISFIILSDPSLKAIYDKFGILELPTFLKPLGVDCQVSLMAFCRGVWFSCFQNHENLQERDINNVAQCGLSKLSSTSMNYPIKKTYPEQDLADDRLMMDFYEHLNTDNSTRGAFGNHAYPIKFVMIPSLFGMTALYNAKLHSDPFYALKFDQDDTLMTSNPLKRSARMRDEDNGVDNDVFMNDESATKRLKN